MKSILSLENVYNLQYKLNANGICIMVKLYMCVDLDGKKGIYLIVEIIDDILQNIFFK